MTLPRISPLAYRRLATATLVASMLIVVTGAAVRLTGSGLGCPTWPNCRTGQLDSTGLGLRGAIEFGNRIITVAITVLVGLTAIASWLLPTRRSDLRLRAVGLVLGVLGDAVIGGITVLTHLDPVWVAIHFLFSMVLLVVALSLHHRAGYDEAPARLQTVGSAPAARLSRLLSGGLVALGAFVLFAGTLATGSGPHAGDATARRLDLAPLDRVTALHADSAMLLTGLVLALALTARVVPLAGPAGGALSRRTTALAVVIVGQVALGFAQYLLHLPALLVLLHVAGATVLWALTVSVRQTTVFELSSGLSEPVPSVTPTAARVPATV